MKLKPYPKYKDSGVPWLGDVPEHWESHKAKFLFMKMNRPVRDSDDVITCFRDGTVTLRKNRRIRGFTESLKEIGYQGIRKGDLVIHQMDAFAGAVGVSDSDGKGTPVYSICYPKRELEPEYFAHLVREMARNKWILCLTKGIRERSTDFRFETFGAQLLPFPPFSEQQQIARYLDWKTAQINKFIRNKRRLIQLLKEQKQNIINQAVTKGINPNVEMKDSGVEWLGQIPAHWEVRRIKTITNILRGKFSFRPRNDPSLYGGKYPFIQTGDVAKAGKYITTYKQTLNEKGYQVSKEFPKGTLTMTIAANIGEVAILDYVACFPDSIVGFVPKKSTVDFLYYLFLAMKPELMRVTPINTQGNLNIERIGNMRGTLPPIREQETIVDYIEKETALIDKTIARTEREIELIQEYRTRLISDVVTGKLDVRGIEIPDFEPVEADLELEEDEESEGEEIDEDE